MDQFEALKVEIERLNRELAQTSSEKIQSAQYGLVLLDEKEELQKKFDELETLYETTKKDLEQLRDAFMKSQNIQKESASSGIEQEERLLQENAFKEANFTSILQELQKEIKSIKNELEREQTEKERLAIENTDLIKQVEIIDWEKKNLKSELKDLKMRETRLFNDNNELEEENISLQKQISMLKCYIFECLCVQCLCYCHRLQRKIIDFLFSIDTIQICSEFRWRCESLKNANITS